MNTNLDPKTKPHRFLTTPGRSKWFWLFAALLAFNLVVAGFDICPKIDRKIARIGIGTIPPADYMQRVRTAAVARLMELPPIRFSDESRLRFIDYLFPPAYFERWPYGLLANGIGDSYVLSPDPEVLKVLTAYGNKIIDSQGRFLMPFNGVETASQGNVLLLLATQTKDPRYRKACDAIAEHYLALYRKSGRPLPYNAVDKASADNLVLVDTIGLLCPFLMEYYADTGRREVMEMSVAQIDEYFKYGIEPRSGLPYHGYNANMAFAPIGLIGWGRGMGWLALGLADTLPNLPAASPERARVSDYARQLAASAIQFQRNDGGWGTMLTSSSSQFDSGCTAMIAYFLLRCRNEGVTQPGMDDAISRSLEALRLKTRRDGTLDFCQGPVIAENRHSRVWEPTSFAQGLLLSTLVQEAIYKAKTKPSLAQP